LSVTFLTNVLSPSRTTTWTPRLSSGFHGFETWPKERTALTPVRRHSGPRPASRSRGIQPGERPPAHYGATYMNPRPGAARRVRCNPSSRLVVVDGVHRDWCG